MKTTFVTVAKNKEFLKIWGAQLVSLICANMLNFLLMGKIYQATESTIAVGLMWGFYLLPTATLGPFVGVFLDWLDKRKVLIWSSLIQALVVLLYLGVGQGIWLIYPIVLLYSFCDEFFNPSIAVLIPSIVKKKELTAANSIFLFTIEGSIVMGFLTGGLLLKFLKFSRFPFILASFLLLFSALLASLLKWKRSTTTLPKLETSLSDFWKELVMGYRFIRNEPKILFPMLLLVGLQIVLGMGLILLPSISKGILAIDFADSSYVLILPAILGAVVGSLVVERIIEKHLKRVLIINGLFLLGVSVLFSGVIIPSFWWPAVLGSFMALLTGISFLLMYIPLQVLIQENTPFKVRGKVFGTLSTLINIAAAVPVLTAVTLVDFLGVRMVLITAGIGILILAFYAARGKYGILPTNYRT